MSSEKKNDLEEEDSFLAELPSFNDDDDDADLVPLFARHQLASQNSQQTKPAPKKAATTIVLLDDDQEEVEEEVVKEKDSGSSPKKRRSPPAAAAPQPKKKSSPDGKTKMKTVSSRKSIEVITLLDSDSDDKMSSPPSSKGASSAGSKEEGQAKSPFTALKTAPSTSSSLAKERSPSPPITSREGTAASPHWDPFADDFSFEEDQFLPSLRALLPPPKQGLQSTPSKKAVMITSANSSTTTFVSSKSHKLLIRSTKKMLSGKKPKFRKTSATTKTVVVQKSKNRSLFTATSKTTTTTATTNLANFTDVRQFTSTSQASTFTSTSATSFLPSIRSKEEAISQHLTVHLSSSYLQDLLSAELEKLVVQGGKPRLKVKVEEEEEEEEVGNLLPTISWTASPSLRALLQTVADIKGALKTTVVGKGGGGRPTTDLLLDQVLVFLPADELHACVAKFVSGGGGGGNDNSDDIFDDDDDLFRLLQKVAARTGATNLTLVIFGLEAYLRGQQRRADRQFRRQLEDLMAAEDGQQKKRRQRRKNNSTEASVSRIPLNLDNIEQTLMDVRMRFHFLGGGSSEDSSKGLPHFSVQYLESGEQLAATLWRYSRSLAEAVWRLSARRDSALAGDLFLAEGGGNSLNSIDPSQGPTARADLWRRQLQQFHGISAAAAEGIARRWPSPRALYLSLRAAPDPVGLLAATPLLSGCRRQVGVELAVKIATFALSSEPGRLLKSATCKT